MAYLFEHHREDVDLEWHASGCLCGACGDDNIGACARAARAGQLHALRWLRFAGRDGGPCPLSELTVTLAAREGHDDVIAWARAQRGDAQAPWDEAATSGAAERGHLSTLKLLLRAPGGGGGGGDAPCPLDPDAIALAARNGHTDVVRWLHAHGAPWDEGLLSCAAEAGNVGALLFARTECEPRAPWDNWCAIEAAKHGHLDFLRTAIELGAPIVVEECWTDAVCHGHIDVMAYLRAKYRDRCSWGPSLEHVVDEEAGEEYDIHRSGPCQYAAANGRLEALQWLRSADRDGGPARWDKSTGNGAVRGGSLALVRWMREASDPPCPWSAGWVTCGAASNGHLSLLKYARAQGLPWDEDTAWIAAENGHLDVLQFMRTEADPPCPWNSRVTLSACESGDLNVLAFARAHGCPFDDDCCCAAAAKGYLNILVWLRAQDPPAPWDERVCAWAYEGSGEYNALDENDGFQLHVLEWLRAQPDAPCAWRDAPEVWAEVIRDVCQHLVASEEHNGDGDENDEDGGGGDDDGGIIAAAM